MSLFNFINTLRHRHGYGIHSPWAYELVTDALFSHSRYYDFDRMDGTEADRQLYRLFIWLRPHTYVACGGTETAKAHMRAAFNSLKTKTETDIFYFAPDRLWEVEKAFAGGLWSVGPHTCIIVDGLNTKQVPKPNLQHPVTMNPRSVWQSLIERPERTSAFDLGNRGLIFFDPARQRKLYEL